MESEFQTVEIAGSGEAVVGEFDVGTDTFRFAVDDVPDEGPLTLHALRFERPGAGDAVTPAAERRETLRSLGYVD